MRLVSYHSYLSRRYKKIRGYYLTGTFFNPELFPNSHQTMRPRAPHCWCGNTAITWRNQYPMEANHTQRPLKSKLQWMKMKAASNSSSSRDTLYFFLFSKKCNYQRRSWPHKWGLTLPSSYKHLRLPQMLSARFGVLCFPPKVGSVWSMAEDLQTTGTLIHCDKEKGFTGISCKPRQPGARGGD